MLHPTGGLLQPQPLNSANNNTLLGNGTGSAANPATNVGTTWKNAGSVNINLDNLLGNSKGKNAGNAPTMNQLKSIHSSPVHAASVPAPQLSSPTPMMPTPTAFGAFPVTPQQPTTIPSGAFMGVGTAGAGFMNGLNNNNQNAGSRQQTAGGGGSLNFGAFQ